MESQRVPDWYTARQAAQPVYGFKVMVEEETDRVLGAHLVGPHADEVINLFALVIRHGLTATALVSHQRLEGMAEIVRAAEAVIALPAYRDLVLKGMPSAAKFEPRARGVFMSFDSERRASMKGMAEAATKISGMFDGKLGYNAASFKEGAEVIHRSSGAAMVEGFPSGSLGEPSAAKLKIDQSRAEFAALAEHLEMLATALSAAADRDPGWHHPGDENGAGNGDGEQPTRKSSRHVRG